MAEGFFACFLALLRAGLNVDEPEGRPVPGRELLPMRHNMVIPPRKWVGRHRRYESMVPDEVARFEKRRSLPVRPSWLPGGAR